MKTQEDTIRAILAFVQGRIARLDERTEFIREQMDKAETKEMKALWERRKERHHGNLEGLRLVEDDLYLFIAHPEVLNALEK